MTPITRLATSYRLACIVVTGAFTSSPLGTLQDYSICSTWLPDKSKKQQIFFPFMVNILQHIFRNLATSLHNSFFQMVDISNFLHCVYKSQGIKDYECEIWWPWWPVNWALPIDPMISKLLIETLAHFYAILKQCPILLEKADKLPFLLRIDMQMSFFSRSRYWFAPNPRKSSWQFCYYKSHIMTFPAPFIMLPIIQWDLSSNVNLSCTTGTDLTFDLPSCINDISPIIVTKKKKN